MGLSQLDTTFKVPHVDIQQVDSYDNLVVADAVHTGLVEDSSPAVHYRHSRRDCRSTVRFCLGVRRFAARGCSDKEQT